MKKIESLKINGKKWFQKSYGNTYHTAEVTVNGEKIKSGITYGYENHYLQTAVDLLQKNGYELPNEQSAAYAFVCQYPHEAINVKRKKDL